MAVKFIAYNSKPAKLNQKDQRGQRRISSTNIKVVWQNTQKNVMYLESKKKF